MLSPCDHLDVNVNWATSASSRRTRPPADQATQPGASGKNRELPIGARLVVLAANDAQVAGLVTPCAAWPGAAARGAATLPHVFALTAATMTADWLAAHGRRRRDRSRRLRDAGGTAARTSSSAAASTSNPARWRKRSTRSRTWPLPPWSACRPPIAARPLSPIGMPAHPLPRRPAAHHERQAVEGEFACRRAGGARHGSEARVSVRRLSHAPWRPHGRTHGQLSAA